METPGTWAKKFVTKMMDTKDYLTSLGQLALVGFCVFVLALGSYLVRFGFDVKSGFPGIGDSATWGQFGDFIGGTTNPIFAFLAFLGVLWTIGLNHKELEETKTASEEEKKQGKKKTFRE